MPSDMTSILKASRNYLQKTKSACGVVDRPKPKPKPRRPKLSKAELAVAQAKSILYASWRFLAKSSTTGGVWRTTEDGNKIFIGGDGEVRAGGPNGPVLKEAAKKPTRKPRAKKEPAPKPATESDSGDSKLTETGDKVKKKRRSREPAPKLNDVIAEYVGTDDKQTVEAFKYFVDEAHAALKEKYQGDREALQEVLSAFGYKGSKASGWIGALKWKQDYTELPGFDQMAEYAAKYHPRLLSVEQGESDKGEDIEQAFFKRLQEGFPYTPAKTGEETMNLAAQMAGPSFFAQAVVADYDKWSKEDDFDTIDVYDEESGFWEERKVPRVVSQRTEELEDAPF